MLTRKAVSTLIHIMSSNMDFLGRSQFTGDL